MARLFERSLHHDGRTQASKICTLLHSLATACFARLSQDRRSASLPGRSPLFVVLDAALNAFHGAFDWEPGSRTAYAATLTSS